MAIYGAFAVSTLGMKAQSHSLQTIGVNIANINTGGYKATDTRFATVLSRTFENHQSDIGGVRPQDYQRIDSQGFLVTSQSDLHVAINGKGFFILNTQLDGSGETLYTRDGAFELRTGPTTTATGDDSNPITVSTGYLVDKNGHYVQGVAANTDGTFTIPGTLTAMRVDQFAFSDTGLETTDASLVLNLDAGAAFDSAGTARELYTVRIVDSDGDLQAATLNFRAGDHTQAPPVDTLNAWTVTVTTGDAGDTVTSTATLLTFAGDGSLTSPTSYTVGVTWANGATSSVPLDISNLTQFAGDFTVTSYDQNGIPASDISHITFDTNGHVVGNFQSGFDQALFKLPLATFPNPNGLEMANGNVFRVSGLSGAATQREPGGDGVALLAVNTRELSNVDLADEFTKMIQTQTIYNASATAFRTADEMSVVARDLKR